MQIFLLKIMDLQMSPANWLPFNWDLIVKKTATNIIMGML